MRSLVLGESNKVVVSLKPSIERLVKYKFSNDTTWHKTLNLPDKSSGP